MSKRYSTQQAHVAIDRRETFTTHGALSGEPVSAAWGGNAGRLYGVDLEQWRADGRDVDYAVYSYATPIAWHTPAGWYRAVGRWSVTTSKHQGQCPRTTRTDLVTGVSA